MKQRPLTVGELKEILEDYPDHWELIIPLVKEGYSSESKLVSVYPDGSSLVLFTEEFTKKCDPTFELDFSCRFCDCDNEHCFHYLDCPDGECSC